MMFLVAGRLREPVSASIVYYMLMRKNRRVSFINKPHFLNERCSGRGWMGYEFVVVCWCFGLVCVFFSSCFSNRKKLPLDPSQKSAVNSIVTTCTFTGGKAKKLCPRAWLWL